MQNPFNDFLNQEDQDAPEGREPKNFRDFFKQKLDTDNAIETVSVLASYAAFILLLIGTVINVYFLIWSAGISVFGIFAAFASRADRRARIPGSRMHKPVRGAMVMAVLALILSVMNTLMYASVFSNPEMVALINQFYGGKK